MPPGQHRHPRSLAWPLTRAHPSDYGRTLLAASRDRRAYLRGHWIDAVALIPTVRGLRLVRLLRFLRLLRLVRVFAGVYRALSSIERLARHRSLIWLFCAWLTVAATCSAALFIAEHGVNPSIDDPWDALWWGGS